MAEKFVIRDSVPMSESRFEEVTRQAYRLRSLVKDDQTATALVDGIFDTFAYVVTIPSITSLPPTYDDSPWEDRVVKQDVILAELYDAYNDMATGADRHRIGKIFAEAGYVR